MIKLLLCVLTYLFIFSRTFSMGFNIWGFATSADEKNLLNMSRIGVTHVLYSFTLPVKLEIEGRLIWKSDADRKKFFGLLDVCEKYNIRLILLTNFFQVYEKLPPEKFQQSRWKIKSRVRSFVAGNDDVVKKLDFFISELKGHSAFGGIIVDDEPGVIAGGDISSRAVKLFGQSFPGNTLYWDIKPSFVEDDSPCISWFEFQRKTVKKYYSQLHDELKRKHPGIKLYIVPAAPYFSGLQLSIPEGHAYEFFKSRRVVTLAEEHIKNYKLYVQYYISELSSKGWNKKAIAAGVWLRMSCDGLPQFCPKPIFSFSEIGKRKTLSPAAFKRFILQTFAEGSKGIVYSPSDSLTDELYRTGSKVFIEYLKPLKEKLPELERLPGCVGIFYSDTNRALADVWKSNPLERYRQLHYCQALAYYLFKRGIPFEIVTEKEIKHGSRNLESYKLVLAAGIEHLSKGSGDILKKYVLNGGALIADVESGRILREATAINFDAGAVYRALLENVMTPEMLEYQAGLLDAALKGHIFEGLAPARSNSRNVNINYLTDGKNIYLFLVNDNLQRETDAEISFDKRYLVSDIIFANTANESLDKIKVKIPPAEMRILKLEKISKK